MEDSVTVTVKQKNIVIAVFMGAVIDKKGNVNFTGDHGHGIVSCKDDSLQYDQCDNWIMPVVRKIFKLELKGHNNPHEVWQKSDDLLLEICGALTGEEASTKSVFEKCFSFLQWYNQPYG